MQNLPSPETQADNFEDTMPIYPTSSTVASDLEHQQSVRDRKDKTYPVPSESPKGVDWRSKGKKIARSFAQDLTTKKTPGSTERVHKTSSDYAGTLVPSYRWLSTYQWKSTLWRDAVAGLTIGLMVVPQGMSYAKLAGLPVQYGLYAAFAPLYIYAVFGSSRHLSVGPVAITSLLLGDGLSAVMAGRGISEDDDSYESVYVQLAIQTSFLVGIIYLAMTIFRLGFITSFLSHSVISGFTSGAAIIIALSQLPSIFGYKVPRADTVYGSLINLFDSISLFNYKTFLLGMAALGLLVVFKQLGSRCKRVWYLKTIGPLTVSVVGIVLVAAFNLDDKGIPIVASIPRGLPPATVELWFPITSAGELFQTVITIVLVGLMESIAIGKQLAKRHNYKIFSNQELYGLGMANMAAALFSAYPITGSFSRSAVNNEAGAQTQISSVVAATVVGLVLLLLTSVFELLPTCIIGAIIIAGVITLVDYPEAIRLWNFDKLDFCVWAITFMGVLFLSAEWGLLCGVSAAFLLVVIMSALPKTRVLGRLPGTNLYRSVKQYPEAESAPGCIVTSPDSPLYFLNAQSVKEKITSRAAELDAETGVFTRYIVLDLASSSDIDSCALHELDDWLLELAGSAPDAAVTGAVADGDTALVEGTPTRTLCLVNPNSTVMRRMEQWGFVDRLGRENVFCSVNEAVASCSAKLEEEEASRPRLAPEIPV